MNEPTQQEMFDGEAGDNTVFPVGSGAIGVPEIYPRRGIDDANQEVTWY
ncbi:hypothetical protein [Nocardia salmonicida]|nr:hypothetical protein [Nocardia salmonicida]